MQASYPTVTAPITINPADADIVYNSTFARWEVSFDVTGKCVLQLNTAQIISNGAKITIAGTKKFRVEGNLIIQQ